MTSRWAAGVSRTGFNIQSRFSPRNAQRASRPSTRFIVLHTTEGAEKGSFNKIWSRGEAHYFVGEKGDVYRIINRSKIATHAGRSLWNGVGPIDNYSIGIEVVGFHDRDIAEPQYQALKELLRQLKGLYKISDRDVVTHSMVAYGRPNRFHPYNHRGRKRCGMIFADGSVRQRLGLAEKAATDKDVEDGRVKVADRELYSFLFTSSPQGSLPHVPTSPDSRSYTISASRTAWDIARENFDRSSTIYEFPNGNKVPGNKIADWSRIPAGTKVLVSGEDAESGFEGFQIVKQGDTAWSLAGEAYASKETIYILPSGMVRTGYDLKNNPTTRKILDKLPEGTKVLVGYIYGGHVNGNRFPLSIAGRKWNYPSTYYRLPDGRIISGDEVRPESIPKKTLVLFQS